MALALLALIVFLDQGSKYLIDKNLPIRETRHVYNGQDYYSYEYLPLPGETKPVDKVRIIPDVFRIEHVVNKGAAWGILHGKMDFLMVISIAALVAMLSFFHRISEGLNERIWGLGLLMGGTAGNLIDRMNLIQRGNNIRGVVDFVSIKYWPGRWWPAFNLADAAICTGVAILCISTFLRPDKDGKRSVWADKIVTCFSRKQENKA